MGKHCVGSERRIVGTRQKGKLLAAGCVAALAAQGQWAGAATVDWTGSASSNWASGSNWVGGNVPISDLITDSAGFNQVSYANQPDAGTRSVGGIQVGDGSTATAPLTISGTQLTLGINGINLATNAGPVTINSPLTLGTGQTWTNASGSTLAVNGTVTRSAGSTLSIVNSGAGSVTSSTLSNDATGIVGPWATYGTGASTRYATVSGGVVSGYTGGTTASSVSYNGKHANCFERIGMAVSDDMVNWKRYGSGPVIASGEDPQRGISGDPQIARMGDVWVMFYFGAFWKPGAFDTFACSHDLVHWTKWEGQHLIQSSEPFDHQYAHKPWVVKWNGVVYHFYCAVGDQGRVLAVATSEDLRRS